MAATIVDPAVERRERSGGGVGGEIDRRLDEIKAIARHEGIAVSAGRQIGLQFRDNGVVQYVLFAPDKDGCAMSHAGRETMDGVLPLIAEFELDSLLSMSRDSPSGKRSARLAGCVPHGFPQKSTSGIATLRSDPPRPEPDGRGPSATAAQ